VQALLRTEMAGKSKRKPPVKLGAKKNNKQPLPYGRGSVFCPSSSNFIAIVSFDCAQDKFLFFVFSSLNPFKSKASLPLNISAVQGFLG
jgi:hypothetical protein